MELTIGKCYYNSFGEQVILDEVVTAENGTFKYIVTPLHEGESMQVTGAGGMHTEIITPYEHYCEQRILTAIYEEEPVAKLGEKAKAAAVRLEAIAEAVGMLKKVEKELKKNIANHLRDEKEHSAHTEEAKSKKEAAEKELAEVLEQVDNARQRLSELEDSVGAHEVGYVDEELARLRKRDFKLECLEAGKVETWQWHDESLKDYYERYPNG